MKQGRGPKELVELGFPRQVVTRVRRRLREEKASQQAKVSEAGAEVKSHPQAPMALPLGHKKLVALEGEDTP